MLPRRRRREGDIGHAKVFGLDTLCACGSRGCLASVASGGALARTLREAGFGTRTTRDVVRLVQQGEPQALEALREAGRQLGGVLATAISMLNPEHVVLGGDLAHVHEHLLPKVRERIDQLTQPLASANLSVSVSRLGDHAGVAGAVVLVRDAVFSAGAVDAALAAAAVAS